MSIIYFFLVLLAALGVLDLLLGRRRSTQPHDRRGDERRGLVVFVESLRWLGCHWGVATAARGLHEAGFRGRVLYRRWHAAWRAWLVLPVIVDARLLEREARRLADFVMRQRRRRPARPIYLVGYSAGGYLVVRALELLEADVRVDGAALLDAAFSPWRDLAPACRRLRCPLVVCCSLLDCLIVGLGTVLVGTADRRPLPSIGMVGPRGRSASHPRVRTVRWRPSFATYGHWGGHFGASARLFIRNEVAPALGVVRENSG